MSMPSTVPGTQRAGVFARRWVTSFLIILLISMSCIRIAV